MKHEHMRFQCPACKRMSKDDTVCSLCGQALPAEYTEKSYFVPGFHWMTGEERARVIQQIQELEEREKHQREDP